MAIDFAKKKVRTWHGLVVEQPGVYTAGILDDGYFASSHKVMNEEQTFVYKNWRSFYREYGNPKDIDVNFVVNYCIIVEDEESAELHLWMIHPRRPRSSGHVITLKAEDALNAKEYLRNQALHLQKIFGWTLT